MSEPESQEGDHNWPDFIPPDFGDSIASAPKEPLLPPPPETGHSGRPAGWHASGNPRWGSVPSSQDEPTSWQPPATPAQPQNPAQPGYPKHPGYPQQGGYPQQPPYQQVPPSQQPGFPMPQPHRTSRQRKDSATDRWFNQPTRMAKTKAAKGPFTTMPFTMAMIAVCVVVWLAQFLFRDLTFDYMMVPGVVQWEPYRLITSAFLHSTQSPAHIGFNMLSLFLMGRYLEPQLKTLRFATIYLFSAVGGSIMQLLLVTGDDRFTGAVGASGAIFGLFGAYLVWSWLNRRPTKPMWILLGLNVAITIITPQISWQSHLGGFLIGVAATAVLVAAKFRRTGVWGKILGKIGITGVIILMALGYAIGLMMV